MPRKQTPIYLSDDESALIQRAIDAANADAPKKVFATRNSFIRYAILKEAKRRLTEQFL